MLDYIKFSFKRIFCRKSNIGLILLAIVISTIFLVMNFGNQDLIEENIKDQISANIKTIDTNHKRLSELNENSEDYKVCKNDIQVLEQQNILYNNVLSSFNQRDWNKMYDYYQEVLKQEVVLGKNMEEDLPDFLHNAQKNLSYINYLKDHNLAYENIDFPIYGLSFITSFSQFVLPIIMTLCCIYILSQFFTLDYVKDLDISHLIPLRRWQIVLTKILVAIMMCILVCSITILSVCFISATLTGNIGLQQPIMLENIKNGTWIAVSAFAFFKEWFSITILFTISLSIFIYILSLFIKEDMYLLITGICIVIGLSFLPTFTDLFTQYIHLLPTTYMNSVSVVDGSLALRYYNMNITMNTGMIVLSLSILIQLLLCMILNSRPVYQVLNRIGFLNVSKFKR